MPFLELNGTDQYLSFIETIPPTPGSTVVVSVEFLVQKIRQSIFVLES